ncbi:uncharacterized protein LOC128922142 [Zeugodacus cucurbitae]|uniref:uncharacterized protein LOC128922142 n=1 Tax=Zeugodacus cucurbitae TaxID=28588 RepID=UPI0023D94775|nr:uncharacterized protein LOC128922142 [Zeugodacus cucurbitae]
MPSQGKIIPENDLLRMFGNDIQINEQGDLTYTCVEEDTDLLNLLKEFDLETLFLGLKNAGITFRSLKYLSKEDIAEAVKNIGLRAEFREKLFFWRKSKFGIEDETLSQTSKVVGWLDKNRHKDSPCSSNNSIRNAFGSQERQQRQSQLACLCTLAGPARDNNASIAVCLSGDIVLNSSK